MDERGRLTRRRYLNSNGNTKKMIDMEEVYRKLDSGMTIGQVARELGVSRTTLYARHNEYQAYVASVNAGQEDYFEGYEDGE